MIHLFKHTSPGKFKGKFDIALVVRGKYVVGSNQGYSRKGSAIKAIKCMLLTDIPQIADSLLFQDDTIKSLPVFRLYHDLTIFETSFRSSKPYIPNKK